MTTSTTGGTDIQIMDRDNGGYAILQQDIGLYLLLTRNDALELAAALRMLTDTDSSWPTQRSKRRSQRLRECSDTQGNWALW